MEESDINQGTPARLDSYLLKINPQLNRSQIQKFIKNGKVTVDGEIVKKTGYIVKKPDLEIKIDLSELSQTPGEDIEMPILYEDDECVIINKPLGVLTHSKGAFNPEMTVASWLTSRPNFDFQENDDQNSRMGIVHRLDRATSGVMICAKNPDALRHLQKQFQDRKAKKSYIARIEGVISPEEAYIDLPIERNPKQPQRFRVGQNGKPSQTTYSTLKIIEKNDRKDSLLELKPQTGRTHQLRVHLDYMKHPIIGDTFYGGRNASRLFLHAHKLEITLPNRQRQTFTAEIPAEFLKEVV